MIDDLAIDSMPIEYCQLAIAPASSTVCFPAGVVRWEVAGSGAISVASHAVVVEFVDRPSLDSVLAVGHKWAWGQWLALNGVFAFAGSVVSDGTSTIALLGAPRAGVSLTALSLIRRGWRLLSDGICPIVSGTGDAAGSIVALAGQPSIQIDEIIARTFPPPEPHHDAQTPRGRVDISVAAGRSAPLSAILSVVPTPIRTEPIVVNVEPAHQIETLRAHSVVGDATAAALPAVDLDLTRFCQDVCDALVPKLALVPAGNSAAMFSPAQIADVVVDFVHSAERTSDDG